LLQEETLTTAYKEHKDDGSIRKVKGIRFSFETV